MSILFLLACVTEANFSDKSVALFCARSEECQKADFESNYDDQGECFDDNEDVSADIVDCYNENCEFDAQGAAEYLSAARAADCDDWNEALGDIDGVYDNCDDMDLAGCLLGF